MRYPNEYQAILNAANTANALLRDWFGRAEASESRDQVLGSTVKNTDYSHYGYEDVFTLADEAAEKAILEILHQCRDIPIVSEESNPHCADWPDGTQRWLVDPIDGTSQFKKGSPNYSVTIALQTKKNGEWQTDIGLVSEPMAHRSFVVVDGQAQCVNETNDVQCLANDTPQTPAFQGDRKSIITGKTIENVLYTKANPTFMQSRFLFDEQLKKTGATPTSTFSTALVMARMATPEGVDGLIMGGNAFDYAWDTDAAIAFAQSAGVHSKRCTIGGEPIIIMAKDNALVTALEHEARNAYAQAQQAAGTSNQR